MINHFLFLPNKLLRFGLLLYFLLVASFTHANNIQVENARLWRAPDNTRLVFDVSSSFTHRILVLTEPARISIDINADNLKADLAQLDLSNTPIKSIRSSQNKGNLRIVLDLSANVTPKIFALKPNQTYGNRLVVDLFDVIPNSNTTEEPAVYDIDKDISNVIAQINAEQNKQAKQEEQITKAEKAEPKNSLYETKPHLPPTNVKVTPAKSDKKPQKPIVVKTNDKTYDQNAQNKLDIIIAIDAGHGGEDPGAIGPKGQREKHIVLSIAKELQREINSYPGFKAELTRTGDYFIPLRKRSEIARNKNASLLVSIHADAAPRRSAFGASVYVVSQKGATSETARWLADSENRSDLIGGAGILDNKNKMLASVLLDLSMTSSLTSSLNVGQKVLNKIGTITPLHKKDVEQAGFVVLKNPDIPSILVETGFISNHNESQKLTTKEHQVKLAKAIAAGIVQFFQQNPPINTYIAWQRDNGKLPRPSEHVVISGDNLSVIAQKYNISIADIRKVNKLTNDTLKVGQVLKLPK